jgi:hypothetical protein
MRTPREGRAGMPAVALAEAIEIARIHMAYRAQRNLRNPCPLDLGTAAVLWLDRWGHSGPAVPMMSLGIDGATATPVSGKIADASA